MEMSTAASGRVTNGASATITIKPPSKLVNVSAAGSLNSCWGPMGELGGKFQECPELVFMPGAQATHAG